MPDPMVVRRDVIFLRQRCDLRRLRVVKNAVAAEACKAVVILEHDHEYVIELRYAVLLARIVILILGLRSRHTYRESQGDC